MPGWWERRDSNPHALRREILSHLRMPFRHAPRVPTQLMNCTARKPERAVQVDYTAIQAVTGGLEPSKPVMWEDIADLVPEQ